MSLAVVLFLLSAVGMVCSTPVQRDASEGGKCSPHLRLPDGQFMTVDISEFYYMNHPKCLDPIVLALLSKRGGQMRIGIEKREGTPICRGLVELLSITEAQKWVEGMCQDYGLRSERRRVFCDSYPEIQKQLSEEKMVEQLTNMKYYDLATVTESLLSLDCKTTCGGVAGSALCSTFLDVMNYFMHTYNSENGVDIVLKPNTPVRIVEDDNPSDPSPDAAAPTDSVTPPDSDTLPDTDSPTSTPDNPSDTPTDTDSPSDTDNPSDTPTDTDSPSDTDNPSDTPTDTDNPSDTPPDTDSPSDTPTDADSPSDTPTDTDSPSDTPTDTDSPSDTPPDTDSPSDTPTDADSPSDTPTDATSPVNPSLIASTPSSSSFINALPRTYMYFLPSPTPSITDDQFLENLLPVHDNVIDTEDAKEEIATVNNDDDDDGDDGDDGDAVVQSHGTWFFFTLFLFVATLAITGYLCVHNRKKIRENISSYMSSDKQRRSRMYDYKPLLGKS